MPHGAALHEELDCLIEAGMTVAEAVRATTSGAADGFGLADGRRIVEGGRADLLVLETDPLTDVEILRTPVEV